MASVWVIESGEYSDYHVVGVFSTLENAERARADCGYGEIAEWRLDPGIPELNAGLTLYEVRMLRDGTTDRIQELSAIGEPSEPRFIDRSKWLLMPAIEGYNGPDYLEVRVFAKDEAHAVKIVNEHRARFIAHGLFPEPAVTS